MLARLRAEDGFTLIELIIVILIIGILAAVALPNFVMQRDRARDSAAKANVRNMETHVEACYTQSQDYDKCSAQSDFPSGIGIVVGNGPNQVEVNPSGANGYELVGHSTTGSQYKITKVSANWSITRTCTVAPGKTDAGCKGGNW